MEAHANLPTIDAPWAEIVPRSRLMCVDDLIRLPDDGWQYEVVEGILVRVGASSYRATRVAGRLFAALYTFVLAAGLGDVTPPDGTYDLDASGRSATGLVPDIGFISSEHLSLILDPDKAIPFAPDKAVEVASSYQSRRAMGRKAGRYLAAGTRLVWIIYPRWQQVEVWHLGDMRPSATLGIGAILDGEVVIPGFTFPVASLFS